MIEVAEGRIHSDRALIDSLQVREVIVECYRSMELFCKVLFPDIFKMEFGKEHKRLFKILDEVTIQKQMGRKKKHKKAIAASRSFGKSSIFSLAYPAREFLFHNTRFEVLISNTTEQALMLSENLKRELISNDVIQELFGNIKSESFSKERWIAQLKGDDIGTLFLPRGSGQQVRGVRYLRHRPHRINIDDAEDSESVRSEEQREKRRNWFFNDVCNSVNVYDAEEDWFILLVGTILHEDSLLANLLELEEWEGETISICDDQYNSNWEEAISTEEIKGIVDGYRKAGELDSFYREYMNLPISLEDPTFSKNYFKEYDPGKEDLNRIRSIESVILVDPAKSVKQHSADSAIVGVGVDTRNQSIYVRDVVAGKMYPDDIYREVLAMADRLRAKVVGIEVTSLNEFITYPFRNELLRKNSSLEIVELKARAKKEERIAALVPFYRNGMVWHNPACCAQLEGQLLSFPRSKRWDVMDALAYIVELLESGNRYFEPPEGYDDDTLSMKELEELEAAEMEEMDDSWRIV